MFRLLDCSVEPQQDLHVFIYSLVILRVTKVWGLVCGLNEK